MVIKRFFNKQNKTCLIIYYDNQTSHQLRHREDGPALILQDMLGNIILEKWYYNDLLHRDDGPAVVIHQVDECPYHKDEWYFYGKAKRLEEWYQNGERHRQGGAAIISYDAAGNVLYEKWFQKGIIHREEGPAFKEYQPEKELVREIWYQWGKIHRDGEPAVIIYLDGVIEVEE